MPKKKRAPPLASRLDRIKEELPKLTFREAADLRREVAKLFELNGMKIKWLSFDEGLCTVDYERVEQRCFHHYLNEICIWDTPPQMSAFGKRQCAECRTWYITKCPTCRQAVAPWPDAIDAMRLLALEGKYKDTCKEVDFQLRQLKQRAEGAEERLRVLEERMRRNGFL